MGLYRKKPVVVEAFQMTEERRWRPCDWPTWLYKAWDKDTSQTGAFWFHVNDLKCFSIRTLEGVFEFTYGDWIIRGVKGELYPCKPGIFEATYVPVSIEAAEAAEEK